MAKQLLFDPDKTVFLIDGSSFLYRAYYSLKPMHTPTGMPIQAVYGFCRMINKLIKTFQPQYMALVWDSKGKTTRHEVYKEYKATRQAPPSDLFEQKEYIVHFADLIGLTQIAQSGIEADDIMFSIAQDWIKKNGSAVFVTSDKDMGQAISDKILLYDPMKEVILDQVSFEQKMGFPVSKMPFYFALLGDVSDNIPGVRGVGKKGAQELVAQFESLEDLYENLDKVEKARTRNALEASKKEAFLSRELFLLQYHEHGLTKKDLAYDHKNWAKARPLFSELNFKSLLKEMGALPKPEVPLSVQGGYTFKTVTTKKELDDLCALIKKKGAVAADTETDGRDALNCECVGVSFCVQEGEAYYIPFGHKVDEPQLSRDEVFAAIKPILADAKIKKYFHQAKFDMKVLAQYGVQVNGLAFDTLIAASLVKLDWQRIGLKFLSEHYFGENMLTYDHIVKQKKLQNFSYVGLADATEYSASDAHQTFKLVPVLQEELKAQQVEKLYKMIEHPLIQVLFDMEVEGIGVDVDILKQLDERVVKELDTIRQKIITLVGDQFFAINLNSPKQIAALLFEHLQLPPQKKGKTGAYSTDEEVLVVLADMHPVPGLILKFRELYKLKSTYIDALQDYINPKTGRVHTTFSQTKAATGRLASFDPNLQNVPVSTPTGDVQLRSAFKPKDGFVFLSADYSQIELRVLAYLSKDKNLTDAFLAGRDIHAETASRLFDTPIDQVTSEQRQVGKRINFSILYGLTPYGLSKDLGIPFGDAKKYIEKYFAQYPGVQKWMEKTIEFTKEHGYVTTHWGRRRPIPSIYEQNRTMYEQACRVAVNTRAQGTAAELMKIGMINLDDAFAAHKSNAKMLLQIHDELLICVPVEKQEETEKLVQDVLESVVDWSVPLVVTTRFGADWQDVTK